MKVHENTIVMMLVAGVVLCGLAGVSFFHLIYQVICYTQSGWEWAHFKGEGFGLLFEYDSQASLR
jgi:hypothetical protein